MPTKEEIEVGYAALVMRFKGALMPEPRDVARVVLEAVEQMRYNIIHNCGDDNHDWTHPLIREDRPE